MKRLLRRMNIPDSNPPGARERRPATSGAVSRPHRPVALGHPLFFTLPLLLVIACAQDEFMGTEQSNRPPDVWLSVAPPEGSTVDYTVHIFWGGTDLDGNISHFEYVITDNETGVFDPADTTSADKWQSTTKLDSVFLFSADVLADSNSVDFEKMRPYEFVRNHTFFIRAVDQLGARSKVKHRSFTALNLSPVITVILPRALGTLQLLVPPVVTFTWNAFDTDSTRSILVGTKPFGGSSETTLDYIRKNPDAPEWTDWIAYDAPADSGRTWIPDAPLGFGTYVFAVQAKDEAGAVNPVFDADQNVRFLRINDRVAGPVLSVSNRFMRTIRTTNTKTAVTVIDLPGGVPVSFTFSADASSYGGVVAGYRYGWDMLDLSDPDQWETTLTPFVGTTAQSVPRTFYFGTHTFYVEVVDNSGLKSRVPVTVNVIPFTMSKPLLIVDDWLESATSTFARTRGFEPSDAEHDAFWEDVVSDVAGFYPSSDTWPQLSVQVPVPITVLADYRAVIWNVRSLSDFNTQTILDRMLRFQSDELNLLSAYMAAGGKVLICGESPMTVTIDKGLFPPPVRSQKRTPSYPVIFRYELGGDQVEPYEDQVIGEHGVGEDSFPYRDCCLNVIDIAYGFVKIRETCRVAYTRTFDARLNGLRTCDPIDDTYDFPRLELRPEVAGPFKFYEESQLGVHADLYNPSYYRYCSAAELTPRRPCFHPMYGLGCLDESSSIYAAPVAFWTSAFADVPDAHGVSGRSAVWGFSPVFFKPDQVKEALDIILFDEWNLPRQ